MAKVQIPQRASRRDLSHIQRSGQVAQPTGFKRIQRTGDLEPLRLHPVSELQVLGTNGTGQALSNPVLLPASMP